MKKWLRSSCFLKTAKPAIILLSVLFPLLITKINPEYKNIMPHTAHISYQDHSIQLSPESKIIDHCQPGDVIFIDIDDTIQTISSYLFQTSPQDPLSQGGRIVDDLKKENNPSFERFLGLWRLSRCTQLVHPDWPALIKRALEKGLLIYGLTHMDTGRCGVMSRIEEWRYNELSKLGIYFTPTYQDSQDVILIDPNSCAPKSPPVFYKGIFFTGSASKTKNQVLSTYLAHNTPKTIVMIDDRLGQIQSAQELHYPSSFIGIVFRGVDLCIRPPLSKDVLEKVIELQKEYLQKEQWIENEEAITLVDLTEKSQ